MRAWGLTASWPGQAWYGLALACCLKGDTTSAGVAAAGPWDFDPDYLEALLLLGGLLKAEGQFLAAEPVLTRVRDLGSQYPDRWKCLRQQWQSFMEGVAEDARREEKLIAGLAAADRDQVEDCEKLELARICALQGRHAAAAQFCDEVFRDQPIPRLSVARGPENRLLPGSGPLGGPCGLWSGEGRRLASAKKNVPFGEVRHLLWLRAIVSSWENVWDQQPHCDWFPCVICNKIRSSHGSAGSPIWPTCHPKNGDHGIHSGMKSRCEFRS